MRPTSLTVFLLLTFGANLQASEWADGGSDTRMSQPARPQTVIDDSGEGYEQESAAVEDPTRTYVPTRKRPRRHSHVASHSRRRGRTSAINSAGFAQFIQRDGSLGPLGKTVKRAMLSSRYRQEFLRGSGIQLYCPKFNSFTSDAQRLNAWVAFWGVLAGVESTFGTDRETYASYKTTYGVWQLERSPGLRRYRGSECRNISTVDREADCAMSIMGDLQFKSTRRHGPRGVYWKGSHWGPIRQSATKIFPSMRRISFCN